jgi:hypothetical protein
VSLRQDNVEFSPDLDQDISHPPTPAHDDWITYDSCAEENNIANPEDDSESCSESDDFDADESYTEGEGLQLFEEYYGDEWQKEISMLRI